MSTYKVIQDIEAEDHILGPLSFRQFIFALIAVLCFYFCYLVGTKGGALFIPIFLVPGLLATFFAYPFGKDQPTEVWALAKIRFLFKPRRRIWDQSGVKELVTITAPKKIEEHLTNGLSETEVKSRLSALANTIDSRGWAIKNVNVNMYTQPGSNLQADGTDSDRLIDVDSLPQEVPNYDVQAADDIMDTQNNPIAQQFDQMINASSQAHRQQLVTMLNQPTPPPVDPTPSTPQAAPNGVTPPPNYWFLNSAPTNSMPQATVIPGNADTQAVDRQLLGPVPAADPTPEEIALAAHLKEEHEQPDAYANLKTILPIGEQLRRQAAMPTPSTPISPASSTDDKDEPATSPQNTLAISPNNEQLSTRNDLNIDTLAREAQRAANPGQMQHFGDDEVVVSLH